MDAQKLSDEMLNEVSGGSYVKDIYDIAERYGFPDELKLRLVASYVKNGRVGCIEKARELMDEYPDLKRGLMKVSTAMQRQ